MEELARRFSPRGGAKLGADEERRVRLFLAFSGLGLVFGSGFGGFYFLVGHRWAALIIALCTLTLASAPWVVRTRGLAVAGNLYALLLVAGFAALSSIEAGVRGHAIAWLAVVPLCACILVGSRAGIVWSGVCLAAVGGFWALELRGVAVPALYPRRWEAVIMGAGYVALSLFMSLLGLFYENGRRRSLARLQAALRELSAANERLQRLDAERREFLGMAAHDLRGPVTLILGYAQLGARQGLPDAPTARSFEQILTAGGRMRDLLDRLLGERAIEDGQLELRPETCEVDALLAAVVATQRPGAQRKGVPLDHVPTGTTAWVHGDRRAIEQILENLVSNALKFSPPGCPVTVRSRVQEKSGAEACVAHLEVADSGPGIPEADFARLFDKFSRLSARPTGGESSTGLGLFIVKRLAEALGGTITCRSSPGEGATFTLTLPCITSLPSVTAHPTAHRHHRPARRGVARF